VNRLSLTQLFTEVDSGPPMRLGGRCRRWVVCWRFSIDARASVLELWQAADARGSGIDRGDVGNVCGGGASLRSRLFRS
jgi:hypothetical protein